MKRAGTDYLVNEVLFLLALLFALTALMARIAWEGLLLMVGPL